MTIPCKNPIDAAAAGPSGGRVAVESWENEGGQLPAAPGAAITPSDVTAVVRDEAAASAALAAMRAQFLTDFAGGSVGLDHNTYRHRSRVLRQRKAAQPQ